MLKIAVTAPIATARINTTVADNQPPRRTFLDADLKSVASVMGAPLREQWRDSAERGLRTCSVNILQVASRSAASVCQAPGGRVCGAAFIKGAGRKGVLG